MKKRFFTFALTFGIALTALCQSALATATMQDMLVIQIINGAYAHATKGAIWGIIILIIIVAVIALIFVSKWLKRLRQEEEDERAAMAINTLFQNLLEMQPSKDNVSKFEEAFYRYHKLTNSQKERVFVDIQRIDNTYRECKQLKLAYEAEQRAKQRQEQVRKAKQLIEEAIDLAPTIDNESALTRAINAYDYLDSEQKEEIRFDIPALRKKQLIAVSAKKEYEEKMEKEKVQQLIDELSCVMTGISEESVLDSEQSQRIRDMYNLYTGLDERERKYFDDYIDIIMLKNFLSHAMKPSLDSSDSSRRKYRNDTNHIRPSTPKTHASRDTGGDNSFNRLSSPVSQPTSSANRNVGGNSSSKRSASPVSQLPSSSSKNVRGSSSSNRPAPPASRPPSSASKNVGKGSSFSRPSRPPSGKGTGGGGFSGGGGAGRR